jgi:hypothetical protein
MEDRKSKREDQCPGLMPTAEREVLAVQLPTVAREFARVTGLQPLNRYTVIRRQGGNFNRAVTLAADIHKAYDQALALAASDFKQVDPSYRTVFAGLDEDCNIAVFEQSAERHIEEGELRWADEHR